MARESVFYSFHFKNDVLRVQQVRNMGVLEGNEPVTKNDWESIKNTGAAAVEQWIDDNMKYKRCVVVLVGSETSTRPWVMHEIRKAWDDGRGLLGIHIHNLKCPNDGTCSKGANPFAKVDLKNGMTLDTYVPCYDPPSWNAYAHIEANLAAWVKGAIDLRK